MADRFMYMGKDLTGAPGLLSGLADVNISSTPSDKQVLSYNETNENWEPSSIAADDIAYDNDNSVKDEIDNCLKYDETIWQSKIWNDFSPINGHNIWTDGENIYYSNDVEQYVLDKSTNTWNTKTWNGLTRFSGHYIWTDGTNTYYSTASNQYVLDKTTSIWSPKIWTGLTNFYGNNIWTDGENIYHSLGTNQYVLNKSTSTWNPKTWTGLTEFTGSEIWTDGENIYYSTVNKHYVLDKSTDTWNPKIWSGIQSSFHGMYVWTDGENIYYSSASGQHILDKVTGVWYPKTWNISSSFTGDRVWTDGENTYYSNNTDQYILAKTNKDIQDVQDQVDTNTNDISTLNSALEWKSLQTAPTGSVVQQLPSGWKELLVIVRSASPDNNNLQFFTLNIHNASCSSTNNNFFYDGYYVTSSINAGIQLKMVGKSTLQLTTAYINGTDVISNMVTGVYYK